jgi:hypothetical protein
MQKYQPMNRRQLSLYCGAIIAAGVGPSLAQQSPAPNPVDWGGGYVRYVRDPAGVTAATSGGAQRTAPAPTAKPAAQPVARTAAERAVDWGGGYIRYVTDPAGATKATAGAGDKN